MTREITAVAGCGRNRSNPGCQRLRLVGVVAREQLVAAVAGECDRHVLARQLRHHEGREQRHIRERLVQMHDEPIEQGDDVGRHESLPMVRRESLRDLSRKRQLVVAAIVESHAEAVHRGAVFLRRFGHEGDHGARVDSAREEHAERHVAHHLGGDGVAQLLANRVHRVVFGPFPNRDRRGVPVTLDAQLPVTVDEIVRRREPADPREDRARGNDVLVGEELIQRDEVQLAPDTRCAQQRFDFRSEDQPLRRFGVVEGLFARAIASGDQRPRPPIPQHEREHAVQARDEGRPVLLVRMRDDFDVRARLEDMPPRRQIAPQRFEVVDLAVGHRLNRAVFVAERLVAVHDVDDRQSPHAERGARLRDGAVLVRAAVDERRHHRLQF